MYVSRDPENKMVDKEHVAHTFLTFMHILTITIVTESQQQKSPATLAMWAEQPS